MTTEAANKPVAVLPPFLRRQLGLRAKSRIPYDDLVRIRFGEDAYILTDAADIRHVLVTKSGEYIKTPRLTSARGKQRAGAGLLTSSGAEHRRQRLLMQPVFHQQVIDRFAAVVQQETTRALERFLAHGDIDVAGEMSQLALSVLIGVLFGVDYHDENGTLAAAIRARRRYTEYVYHSHVPFRERLPTPTVRANRTAVATLDRIIYDAIATRRVKPTGDMISLLTEAAYADGSRMTDQQVRDEVLTLTSTGHETIGDALGWTFYLLAQHPEIERRWLSEIDTVLRGAAPTAADIRRLPYTGMILSESLRLYPPTWIYSRVPLVDAVLPSTRQVRKGWTLYLCPYVMHRHPVHFPDPERFDPERFAAKADDRPKLAYFPFGGGPHSCIGEVFARLEGVLALSMIGQRVRCRLAPRTRVVPAAGVTLFPKNGIRMQVHPRG